MEWLYWRIRCCCCYNYFKHTILLCRRTVYWMYRENIKDTTRAVWQTKETNYSDSSWVWHAGLFTFVWCRLTYLSYSVLYKIEPQRKTCALYTRLWIFWLKEMLRSKCNNSMVFTLWVNDMNLEHVREMHFDKVSPALNRESISFYALQVNYFCHRLGSLCFWHFQCGFWLLVRLWAIKYFCAYYLFTTWLIVPSWLAQTRLSQQ